MLENSSREIKELELSIPSIGLAADKPAKRKAVTAKMVEGLIMK
jgi:hypothetical protein